MSYAIPFNLDQSKVLSSGNELITQRKKPFENIVGNQHFLLFPQSFLLNQDKNRHFSNSEFVNCKDFEFGPVQTFVIR